MDTLSLESAEGKWLMVSVVLASSMAFIDGSALNVVLPSLQKSLSSSGPELFWILNSYLLMLASLILIGGSLGDKMGRKKVFVIGILIFLASSFACGLSPTVSYLIFFRLIQGVGGAMMIPGSLSLISSNINPSERGKAIGTWSAFSTAVMIAGPILGGTLADAGLWRFIFFINIPIGILALFIITYKVKESVDLTLKKRIDYIGAICLALGLAFLTFGFLRLPEVGITNVQVYLSLPLGILLLIFFIYFEKGIDYAMMPLSLFTNSSFSGVNLLTFFLYAGLGAGMLFLSLNVVQIQGYSQLQSGLIFLPFTLLMISLARLSGSLADRLGPRLFLMAGSLTAGLGLFVLSLIRQTGGPGEFWTSFFPGILILGLGMSFTVAPLTTTVMNSVSDHYSGTASGVNNAMSRIANVFANAIFGALAVIFFAQSLNSKMAHTSLNPQLKTEIKGQASNLGNAKIPEKTSSVQKIQIQSLYKESFIDAYGIILRISAILCFFGSFIVIFFIRNRTQNSPSIQISST